VNPAIFLSFQRSSGGPPMTAGLFVYHARHSLHNCDIGTVETLLKASWLSSEKRQLFCDIKKFYLAGLCRTLYKLRHR
jgi:hypothetical protein